MRKPLLSAAMASTLLLGGCAAGLGGGTDPLAGILGAVLGGGLGNQGGSSQDFERAAINACGDEASRYGQVGIDRVEQNSRDTVRVDGRVQIDNRTQRQFTCTFRSDGRIIDFRIA